MYHLAVDIGASSGRHIIGWVENGIIHDREVHRFENGLKNKNGTLCWDTVMLFNEIKTGMKKCAELGMIPSTMSIDMWGVDFVLLDKNGDMVGNSVGYRDSRTEGYVEKVSAEISDRELYDITGIKSGMINTLFQLKSVNDNFPEQIETAVDFLMLPDYFVYLLTGKILNEYTNSTTTELIDLKTNDWAYGLIERLGLKKEMFHPVSMPGTSAGNLKTEVLNEVGFDTEIILAPSHDTASAIMAVPSNEENVMYISSGTWSLMGIESDKPQLADICMKNSFTNEGGYNHRYTVLKNIMGLWMIQSVKREFDNKYSFAELCSLAEKDADFPATINALDDRFLAPDNMTEEIKAYCADTNQKIPETVGEIAAVVYNSLAKCYAECAEQIEGFTGKKYPAINIIGGGSNADYLNKITAKLSGKTVLAGPGEATAIGNLINQMMVKGVFSSLNEARLTVKKSYKIKEYKA
jgi:rhamnulokinase